MCGDGSFAKAPCEDKYNVQCVKMSGLNDEDTCYLLEYQCRYFLYYAVVLHTLFLYYPPFLLYTA